MSVTVTLHATLKKFLPPGTNGSSVVLEMRENATVADIVTCLGIPPDHAKMMVSGDEYLQPTSALHDGQEINLFPPLAGG